MNQYAYGNGDPINGIEILGCESWWWEDLWTSLKNPGQVGLAGFFGMGDAYKNIKSKFQEMQDQAAYNAVDTTTMALDIVQGTNTPLMSGMGKAVEAGYSPSAYDYGKFGVNLVTLGTPDYFKSTYALSKGEISPNEWSGESAMWGMGLLMVAGPMKEARGLSFTPVKNNIFQTGANITPRSVALKYRTIGRGGRTFVTEPSSITKIIGNISTKNRVVITSVQARLLENELGLMPNSLEKINILSVVEDIPNRIPEIPVTGNKLFLGSGKGLPGGGSELTIQGIPSSGGVGIRQIIVEVLP